MVNLHPDVASISALNSHAAGQSLAVKLKASQPQAPRLPDSGVLRAFKERQSSSLDGVLVQMEDALTNLGNLTPAANGSSSNPQGLSTALQSVSDAQSAIAASADTVYQSTLDSTASAADKLVANIDTASGDFDFNIEQTLLQAGGNILQDRSTISALVTYLLQQ